MASIGLRNELREPSNDNTLPYTWNNWIENMVPAANAVHGNNSDTLIFFSGLNYDLDNTYFIQNQTWNGATFTPSAYAFKDKIAYEIHNYQNSAGSCDDIRPGMYKNAYCAMNLTDPACPNHGPTVLTEFGFDQTDGSYTKPYAQCISSIVTEQPGGPGGWMQWALAGSYYIRSGIQDFEEPWGELAQYKTKPRLTAVLADVHVPGLLNHDWSAWRNQDVIDDFLKPLVQKTL